MWSKCLILAVVVGVCIAATVTVEKPKEKLVDKKEVVVEDLKPAETRAYGRQFSHGGFGQSPYLSFGGYGGYGGAVGGFGGYGGYGGAWGGHHSHGGYGGYGHASYPHGGGYGHHHHG